MLRRNQTASALITARRHPAGHLEAHPARGSGRRGEVLASFMQSDVQGDLTAARALLAEIAAAERGQESQPAVGNAYSVIITSDGVLVRNVLIEASQPQRYAHDEIRRALGTWIAAIERAGRSAS
jgi:hypothetical protein